MLRWCEWARPGVCVGIGVTRSARARRVFEPAATEHLVERHQIRDAREPRANFELLAERGALRERVGHFAERRPDRLLVLRDADAAARVRAVEIGLVGAAIENRQRDLRHEAPRALPALEQVAEVGTAVAGRGRQADARVEVGACRNDVGVGGAQLAFGLQHVGPALQQVRRQAGGQSVPAERSQHVG